ncbi:lysophospholipase [Clostridium gelidum]|uniref:Lysophospholipase n=1 Tax=Clostridium gelidum TaxID=704125 RepID=A0ABN6ITM5_9CLOT|nr:alpha/beta hydrolase [Clostridium gelidum]BCZ45342.1 lysophospholipase [Clostridium gelidum]
MKKGAVDSKRYISQNNYNEEMLNKVEPYLQKNLKCGYILGVKNVKLYYEKFIVKNAKANIVICHGLGEFTEKYYELIYYFMKEGYSVFIIEHRGHGRSQRIGIDNCQINVEKFNYYIEDFKKFIEEIVIPNSDNKNLLLFAHSMGGGIGTVFLEEYTNYFKAAVLSSPMHEINTGKTPTILANIISNVMKLCGNSKMYLPGQIPYSEEKSFISTATSCKERYEYVYEKIKNNNEYHSGGTSALWYIESSKATRKLVKKENASKVKIPVLLFQAEYDTYVISRGQNKFASYAKDCELIHVKGAKHESYFEKDEILFDFLDKAFLFYENNLK